MWPQIANLHVASQFVKGHDAGDAHPTAAPLRLGVEAGHVHAGGRLIGCCGLGMQIFFPPSPGFWRPKRLWTPKGVDFLVLGLVLRVAPKLDMISEPQKWMSGIRPFVFCSRTSFPTPSWVE